MPAPLYVSVACQCVHCLSVQECHLACFQYEGLRYTASTSYMYTKDAVRIFVI